MANKDDYLTNYRHFFESFAKNVNPNEQLPVKLATYKFINHEVIGGIIDWTTQYLNDKKCPLNLISPLIKIVIDEVRKNCKKNPTVCGYNALENAYEPLKLMQSVILQVNEICLKYLDNSELCTLPSPGPPFNLVSYHAIRNTRRHMEDRHAVVHDLNTIFNNNMASPSSYYAIFDGHAGQDAAAYSAAHLHQFLAESKYFAHDPENALIDAFCKTDLLFLEKCKVENFSSGTTAVCALLRPKEKSLYIAWVGDSQAIISKQGIVTQCVDPHKPNRKDERARIEKQGGTVLFWGTWRVSGQLAVSRAIGNPDYKPFITAVPQVREIQLDGTEDFLVVACDGLWDVFRDDECAKFVYKEIYANTESVADTIALRLVQESKEKGSTDNISVIVVFLREPAKIAADPHWDVRTDCTGQDMEAGFDNANAQATNPFVNSNGAEILSSHPDGFLLNLDGFRVNAPAKTDDYFAPANGKREFDDDDMEDMGPETDVDALDDAQSPGKLLSDMSEELELKVAKEIDANLLKNIAEHCNLEHDDIEDDEHEELIGDRRKQETPTPPADEVHDGGLDSDSDEDEWNYIKGEGEDKENLDPTDTATSRVERELESALAAVESEEIDNMSQLNPNAVEFVPVSPTRTMESPVCSALKDEQILAQSPRRPNPNFDFNLPNEDEFKEEVKHQPSDFYSNGHDNENGLTKQSSQEARENLMNGKNADDIDFQSGSPSKTGATEEFLFGPNAAAFSTPSKFMDQSRTSTKATFGDDSTLDVSESPAEPESNNPFGEADLLARLNKEDDPMSMSFYQDKEDDQNPFDLNKVQRLPVDDDEEPDAEPLESSFNDTISDLPEHKPLADLITTDLDMKEDLGICALPQSPQSPQAPAIKEDASTFGRLVDGDVIECQTSVPEIVEEKKFDTDDEIIERPQEPLVEIGARSPMPDIIAEESEEVEAHDLIQSPGHFEMGCPDPVICYASREAELQHQEAASEEVSASSDIQQHEFILEAVQSEIAQSPEPVILDQTPDLDVDFMPAPPLVDAERPPEPDVVVRPMTPIEVDLLAQFDAPRVEPVVEHILQETSLIGDFTSPDVQELSSPVDDVTSSVKDDSPMDSPIRHELITLHEEVMHPAPVVEDLISQVEKQETPTTPTVDLEAAVIAPVVAAAAAVTMVAIGAGVVAEDTKKAAAKPKTTPTAKRPASATTAKISATKPAASKTMASKTSTTLKPALPAKTQPKTTTMKTSTARTALTAPAKAPAKPRTAITSTTMTTKLADKDKKPLTNGDVKPAATAPRIAPIRRPQVPSTTRTTVPKTTSEPAKTTTAPKPATARPTTTSTLRSKPLGTLGTTAATKPKTTTTSTTTTRTMLTSRTAPTTRPLSSSATTTTKSVTMKTSTSTVAAKPKPASAPLLKPRVPLSARTTKTPDTEKQNKENVNKLTASRTATTRTTTTRKLDPTKTAPIAKSMSTKTAVTKKPGTKTPSATPTKPKEETEVVANGVPAEKACENKIDAEMLLKDLSPVNNMIIDNSQLADATAD